MWDNIDRVDHTNEERGLREMSKKLENPNFNRSHFTVSVLLRFSYAFFSAPVVDFPLFFGGGFNFSRLAHTPFGGAFGRG